MMIHPFLFKTKEATSKLLTTEKKLFIFETKKKEI